MDLVKLVEVTANQPFLSVPLAILLLGNPTLRRHMRTVAGDVRCVFEWFRDLPERAYQQIQRDFWSDVVAGCLLIVFTTMLVCTSGLVLIMALEGWAQTPPMLAVFAFFGFGFGFGFMVRFMWATLQFVRRR